MDGRAHIDFTKALAEAVSWPGEMNRIARAAEEPDSVTNVRVGSFGAHLFGLNTASMVHFPVIPEGEFDKQITVGYNWDRDDSVPGIDLPDVDVYCRPEVWDLPGKFLREEPLWKLLKFLSSKDPKTKKPRGSIAADELTWPSSTAYAEWMDKTFSGLMTHWLLADTREPFSRGDWDACLTKLSQMAGWMCHFIEDACIPHHVYGVLLNGHSSFEGSVTEALYQSRLAHESGKDNLWGSKLQTILEAAKSRGARECVESAAHRTYKLFDIKGRLQSAEMGKNPYLVVLEVGIEETVPLLVDLSERYRIFEAKVNRRLERGGK